MKRRPPRISISLRSTFRLWVEWHGLTLAWSRSPGDVCAYRGEGTTREIVARVTDGGEVHCRAIDGRFYRVTIDDLLENGP